MPGVPASLTMARCRPASRRRRMSSILRGCVWLWKLMSSFFGIPRSFRRFPVTLVSSQTTASHVFRVSMARSVMSPRFPIGVETMESVILFSLSRGVRLG